MSILDSSLSSGSGAHVILPISPAECHICLCLFMVQPYSVTGLTYPPQYVAPAAAAQQEQLRQFWLQQMQEIHQVGTDPAEFKNHQLPLARIKKVKACLYGSTSSRARARKAATHPAAFSELSCASFLANKSTKLSLKPTPPPQHHLYIVANCLHV